MQEDSSTNVTVEANEQNEQNIGNTHPSSHKSGITILLFLILIILLIYPFIEYTSLFTTNHILRYEFIPDEKSAEASKLPEAIYALKNGGFLKMDDNLAREVYENDISSSGSFARTFTYVSNEGDYYPGAAMLNLIGYYGWKYQESQLKSMIFTKTKFRFLP